MSVALLIVDVQNDYARGGKMELVGFERALEKVQEALQLFRQKGKTVIHVQHVNTSPKATFFLPDTPGVSIHPRVSPKENEMHIVKHFPNSFHETRLADVLAAKNVRNLVVCGMMTHMCIDTTVRSARERGFLVTLLEDACATRDLMIDGEIIPARIVHKAFMASIHGVFANVIPTQALNVESLLEPLPHV